MMETLLPRGSRTWARGEVEGKRSYLWLAPAFYHTIMKPLSLPPPAEGYEDEQDEKDLHEDEVRAHSAWEEECRASGYPSANLVFLLIFVLGIVWWAIVAFTRSFLLAYAVTVPLFAAGLVLIYCAQKRWQERRWHDDHFADVCRGEIEEEEV